MAALIRSRADANKPHMGLTTWTTAPQGKILAGDVTTGKNYLSQHGLQERGQLVEAVLSFVAELPGEDI
ncbi:MAG: RhuM family protein [Corynebacterium sp.]|nr:RhuM family protein [Corynebacterium sp.]